MDLTDHVVVLTTLPPASDSDAAGFATALVEERLAACVNIYPEMESVYRWKGQVERERERQIVIKTTAARLEALRERVRQLHPYEMPEFIVLPVIAGSKRYLAWMMESTAGGR